MRLPWAGPSSVPAADLPADTNRLERLTPEQARTLAAEFPGTGIEIEVRRADRWLLGDALPRATRDANDGARAAVVAGLPLNGLTSIDAETAAALATYARGPLLLNGLTELNCDTARALARFGPRSSLMLEGLTTLDADTAEALAAYRAAQLRLDAGTARALVAARGWTGSLPNVATLDLATARVLLRFDSSTSDCLDLTGLTTLDAAGAQKLTAFPGRQLALPGLIALDPATAQVLVGLQATCRNWPRSTPPRPASWRDSQARNSASPT
jgi:hypothetical protein